VRHFCSFFAHFWIFPLFGKTKTGSSKEKSGTSFEAVIACERAQELCRIQSVFLLPSESSVSTLLLEIS